MKKVEEDIISRSIPTKSMAMDSLTECPGISTSNEEVSSDSDSNSTENSNSVLSAFIEQSIVTIVSETNLTVTDLFLPTNDDMNFDYFKVPDPVNRSLFIKYHLQTINREFYNWNKTFYHKNKYCFVCMAYGSHDKCSNLSVRDLIHFQRGHHYIRIREHENSA